MFQLSFTLSVNMFCMHDSCHLNYEFGKFFNIAGNFDNKMSFYISFELQILVEGYAWHVPIVSILIFVSKYFLFISKPLPHAAVFDIVLFVFQSSRLR